MIIAVTYNKKKVHWFEFAFGILISLGMVMFAVADFHVYPKFDVIGMHIYIYILFGLTIKSCICMPVNIGIVLVCISVVADAFLPNFQERVFDHGSSRIEVTYFTNILTLTAMTAAFTSTGDLQSAFGYVMANPQCLWLMVFYTFLAYIAITLHMILVKEFGGITTVLVGNTRKAITICLSFILFPKPVSVYYAIGGVLVFGSLIGNAFMKEKLGGGGGKRDSGFGGV
jgi:adenosine 3'-phospho 5'-phosphosulfate transporter B3